MRPLIGGLAAITLSLTGTAAHAQTPPTTIFTIQAQSRVVAPSFPGRADSQVVFEPAVIDVDYDPAFRLGFNMGVARRLSSRFGAIANMSLMSAGGQAHVRGQLPHPLYFDRPRDVAGASDVSGTHLAADLLAAAFWQPADRLTIVAGAGPTVMRVTQSTVQKVLVAEAYPYDTVNVIGLDTRTVSGTGVGIAALVDATWHLGPRAGLGASLQFTRASIRTGGTAPLDINAGGVRAGLGLRFHW